MMALTNFALSPTVLTLHNFVTLTKDNGKMSSNMSGNRTNIYRKY